MTKIKTALISVSDKRGVVPFATALRDLGVQLISTGGTAKSLRKGGLDVIEVSERTGFPEILDGRVKTLHPRIHAAILARHSDTNHNQTLKEHSIDPIELVVVNLYPFSETISRSNVTREQAIEQIDIGGSTLVRAAAKNSDSITVIVDPEDYPQVIDQIKEGQGCVSFSFRKDLAIKAFQHTATYDESIATWLERSGNSQKKDLPARVVLNLEKVERLRYGENPHQRAGLYFSGELTGFSALVQHQGKELSFNNLVDLNAAWQLSKEFNRTACCIIKHNNPCGTALAELPAIAFERALECDPVSAFGSVVAFNCFVDEQTAERINKLFVEVILAPGFHSDALKTFSRKKNLRVIEMPSKTSSSNLLDIRSIEGGFFSSELRYCFPQKGGAYSSEQSKAYR